MVPRFIRSEGSSSVIDTQPLWWPPAKIVGRYLSPFLAEHLGLAAPLAEPPTEAIAVEVALDTRDHAELVSRLSGGRGAADDRVGL